MRIHAIPIAVVTTFVFFDMAEPFQVSHRIPSSPLARTSCHVGRRSIQLVLSQQSWRESIAPKTSLILSATETSTSDIKPQTLNEKQLDFTLGYLNKHHRDVLGAFAETFSELGEIKARKNSWTGGTYKIEEGKIIDIDTQTMTLEVCVNERNKDIQLETVTVDLDAVPVIKTRSYARSGNDKERFMTPVPRDLDLHPVDDIVRRLCRLCWIVDKPQVTGKLVQLGIQIGETATGKIKDNMYLNQVPHNRYVRKYFYDMAADAALEAVTLCSQGKICNRMKITAMFPEMNPSMDSYRIGTILEMVRAIAIRLVEQNLRVRVCVQGTMVGRRRMKGNAVFCIVAAVMSQLTRLFLCAQGVGIFTGLPKQLNGVNKLLQMMDWQSEEGEENEGMVGTFLNFGSIGADHVVNAQEREDGTKVEQDDVFILIAPQSMVGVDSSIIGPLKDMVKAAGDRPIILINPDLTDKVSAQGQQNVRGRQDRIDFANSFKPVWHFQNIYVSGTSYFPILGSIFKPGPRDMWIAHQRRDLANSEGEVYVPILAGEETPWSDEILEAFES
jgi:adenylate kinase